MEMLAYLHLASSYEEAVNLSSSSSLLEASVISDIPENSIALIQEALEQLKIINIVPLVFQPENNSYVYPNY